MLMQQRIEQLLDKLGTSLVEKEEALRIALLAAIAGESVFFLGPPGTAKSMVSRRIRYAFSGQNGQKLNYFEYLMQQFSTPDELFGPVSLKALENDEYRRIVEGYLPQSDVVFLDEIWKAGPAIQNTLLTIINEKKFHNGKTVIDVPLKALISASNELPAENQGLEALWDRFLLRLKVDTIKNESTFLDLVCGTKVKEELKFSSEDEKLIISIDELNQWQKEIGLVDVPSEVRRVITAVRQEMSLRNTEEDREEKEYYYVSDRRWTKIVYILKTAAFLNGRTEVDLMDCLLIKYCIWNTENQIDEASEIVEKCILQNGADFTNVVEKVKSKLYYLDEYIKQKFYVMEKGIPLKVEMNNGTMAYKFVKEEEVINNTYALYIATDYEWGYDNLYGACFDKNKDLIVDENLAISSYSIEKNNFKWNDKYNKKHCEKIHVEKTSYIKDRELYASENIEKLNYRIKKADEEVYNPLISDINDKIEELSNYCKLKESDFNSNLFTEHYLTKNILSSYEAALDSFYDLQLECINLGKSYK